MVIPSRSSGVTLTASGRSTSPLTTNSRKPCIAKPESSANRDCPSGFANEAGHGVARLRALAEPILYPLVIEDKVVALFQRLIGADFLNELAVARTAAVRHHDAEHRGVFRPDSFHAYSHCHKSRCSIRATSSDTPRPASFSDWGSKRGVRVFMLLGVGKP